MVFLLYGAFCATLDVYGKKMEYALEAWGLPRKLEGANCDFKLLSL
jgi:hypothetical protein